MAADLKPEYDAVVLEFDDGTELAASEVLFATGRAPLTDDGYTGRARMVVDVNRDHLLGVTLVGPGVTEILHAATIAVAGQVPIDRLWHAVPCFPTIGELWLRLLEA